jgi:hypothetical protein
MNCNRCHNLIPNFDSNPNKTFTCGYYDISHHNSPWWMYRNLGEKYVCDWCIHTDARYIADYGPTAESIYKDSFGFNQ